MYGKQQVLVTEQAKTIDFLKAQLQASEDIVAACNANAAEANAGRAAAAAAAAARSRASVYTGASRAAAASSAACDADDDDDDEEAELAERKAALLKLQGLGAQKADVEAELLEEQGKIFEELKELKNMMAELG